jgi:hypothetical protein
MTLGHDAPDISMLNRRSLRQLRLDRLNDCSAAAVQGSRQDLFAVTCDREASG